MSKEAVDKAKVLFDQELNAATEEVIKRWEQMYKQSGNKYKLLDLLKKFRNSRNSPADELPQP